MGTPSVGVMTERFVSAAALMAKVLGLPDYGFAVIGHPISSASDAQLESYARAVMTQMQTLLVK